MTNYSLQKGVVIGVLGLGMIIASACSPIETPETPFTTYSTESGNTVELFRVTNWSPEFNGFGEMTKARYKGKTGDDISVLCLNNILLQARVNDRDVYKRNYEQVMRVVGVNPQPSIAQGYDKDSLERTVGAVCGEVSKALRNFEAEQARINAERVNP